MVKTLALNATQIAQLVKNLAYNATQIARKAKKIKVQRKFCKW